MSNTNSECCAEICVSAQRMLLNDSILEQLRSDSSLSCLVQAMRKDDRVAAGWIQGLDGPQVHLACQRDIFMPLEEEGVEPPTMGVDPREFAQAVYDLPRRPRTAWLRRAVRENARVYAQSCAGGLHVPDNPDGLHALWERAMEGEPRWNDAQYTPAFRGKPARVFKGKGKPTVLQVCVDPADYEVELSRLLEFAQDTTIQPEIRAACGYALFEWIHPFSDGNGHVGRMLALALLQDTYSLPSMIRFSQALVWGRGRTARLFALLRTGEGTLVDFCRGTLEQLNREQAYALE